MRRLLATIGCVGLIGSGTLFAAPSAHAAVGNCTSAYFVGLTSPTNTAHHLRYPPCLVFGTVACLGLGPSVGLAACVLD